jgi:hypothetical protein
VIPVSTTTIARLVKVLGMLGSPHAGERAAAGLRVCHDYSDQLSVKERGLIDVLSRWRGAPTPKQIKWLTDIYERLWGRPD